MGWYLLCISVIAFLVTGYDKWAAKYRKKNRTPERTLWLIALLGGSASMWLTMLLVRHKTRHKSFMVGLPAMMLGQMALIYAIFKPFF